MKRFRQRKAFTVIEMVVVIAVIAILATVLVPTISGVIQQANLSTDKQFAASLNVQLVLWQVEENRTIQSESDLRDAINDIYDDEKFYSEKLLTKSVKQGNYYWYAYDKGVVFVANVDNVESEYAKIMGESVEAPANRPEEMPVVQFLSARSDDNEINSVVALSNGGNGGKRGFKENTKASLRSDLFDGTYLMGCKGHDGDVLDIITKFENLDGAQAYEDTVAALDKLAKVEEGKTATKEQIAAGVLVSKVAKTTIITNAGAFRYDTIDGIEAVYVSPTTTYINVATNVCVYNTSGDKQGKVDDPAEASLASDATIQIMLPENVIVAPNGLPAIKTSDDVINYEGTTEVFVNANTKEDLEKIFDMMGTNCVIVTLNGDRYILEGECIYALPLEREIVEGEPVGDITSDPFVSGLGVSANPETGVTPEVKVEIAYNNSGEKGTDDDYFYDGTLYLAWDFTGTKKLSLANGIPSSLVNWTVSEGALITVNPKGEISLAANAKPVAQKALATVTATLKSDPTKTHSVNVQLVFPTQVEWTFANASPSTNTAPSTNTTIKLSYTEAVKFALSGNVKATQDGYVKLNNNDLAVVFTTSGDLFSIVNNELTLDPAKITARPTTQTLTVTYGEFVEQTYTVEVTDDSSVGLKKNQITTGVTMGDYLFRVGNNGTIALGKLFSAMEQGKVVDVQAVNIYDAAKTTNNQRAAINTKEQGGFWATYTSNTDWANAAVQFGGTGVAIIEVKTAKGNVELAVEVVDGTNVTAATSLGTKISGNIVLLENISLKSGTITLENTTIWGNGFTIDVTGNHGTHFGIFTMKSATIDNAVLKGDTFTTVAFNGNDYYNALLYVYSGDCAVTNSYVYGCRTPIRMVGGTLLLDNTTLDDGAFANLWVESGDSVTLNNVITKKTNNLGMSIYLNNVSTVINITGDLRQYNWVSETEKNNISDTTIKGAASVAFGLTDYVHTVDGVKYVNMGIIYAETPEDGYLNDNRSKELKENVVYGGGKTGNYDYYVYSYRNTKPVSENQEYFRYSENLDDRTQSAVAPSVVVDYNANYKENKNDKKAYCVYNEKDGLFELGVVNGEKFNFDLDIVTVTKYGFSLDNSIDITVNGTAATETFDFEDAGMYTITYSYVDNIIFDKDGNRENATISYEKKVKVKVSTIDAGTHNPDFTFNGIAGKTQLVGNVNYIMPNVSATSDSFGKTDDGVYYPIVAGDGYEYTGNGNEYARIFYIFGGNSSGVTITDYNGQTALTPYTESTTTMPDGVKLESWTTIAGTSTPDNGKWAGDIPEPTTYNNKLCYEGKGHNHDKDIAEGTFLFKYSYQANNGTKYYYYIAYKCAAVSKKCVTPDTLITLADGTQVRVDSLDGSEMLMVWNLETGMMDSAPIMFVDSEEEAELEVIKLNFSDGTEVKVIGEHGFWDYNLNKYVYLDDNAAEYGGHWFAKQNGSELEKVQLVGVVIETETTTAWSPVTQGHLCYFVNGMLSMPGGVGGLFNIFDVDAETMTYDYEALARDIETYGLFTYEEMNAIVPLSEDMFNMAGGAYLKISIGKGNMTMDDLVYMIERYSVYFN